MSWQNYIKNFKNFLSLIHTYEKICLIHHADCDGCVSSVYITKLIKEFSNKKIDKRIPVGSFSYDLEEQKKLIEKISPQVLISLDLDVISDGVFLGNWKNKIKKIFIYDHHKIDLKELETLRLERNNITYLNPRLLDPPHSYPASYFGYSCWKELSQKNEFNEWLLAAGLIGDHALEEHPEIKEIVRTQYRSSLLEENQLSYKKRLREITALINAGYFYRFGKEEDLSFKISSTSFDLNDPGYFFETNFGFVKELHKRRKIIAKECDKFREEANIKAEIDNELPLIIFIIDSHHYVSGLVASELTKIYRTKVIVVGQEIEGKFSFELRTGKSCNIDLTQILKGQKNYFKPLSSGGHPKASGALIRAEDKDIFLSSLKKALTDIIH